MTTHYAQQVHRQARRDVYETGNLATDTAMALARLGYDTTAIAELERRLLEADQYRV